MKEKERGRERDGRWRQVSPRMKREGERRTEEEEGGERAKGRENGRRRGKGEEGRGGRRKSGSALNPVWGWGRKQ